MVAEEMELKRQCKRYCRVRIDKICWISGYDERERNKKITAFQILKLNEWEPMIHILKFGEGILLGENTEFTFRTLGFMIWWYGRNSGGCS